MSFSSPSRVTLVVLGQVLHLLMHVSHPQLRYLQTLNTISAEKNSTIIFPVPIEIISHFLHKNGASAEAAGERGSSQSQASPTAVITTEDPGSSSK